MFEDKKSRIVFSLKIGLAYLPILFFFSLPIFSGNSINPFTFLQYSNAGLTYLLTAVSTVLFFLVIVFSIFLVLKKISEESLSKVFYQLPVQYLICMSPLILLLIIFGIIGLIEGGDSGLAAFLAIALIIRIAFSVIPVFLLSVILFLWLKEKKLFSVLAYFLILISLFLFFAGSSLFKAVCSSSDNVCMAGYALQTNDPEFCEKADTPDPCFSYLAFLTGNSSYCERDFMVTNFCYERVAVKNKDTGICEKNPCKSQGCKDTCYARVYEAMAKETFSLSLCDKAGSYKWLHGERIINLGACYAEIAKNKDDLSICDALQEKEIKNSCYFEFAVYKKDCSIIESSDSKKTCEDIVDYQLKTGNDSTK